MKTCLCALAVLVLGVGVACGDLSEIEDERIRDFVRTAKRVVIDELMTDGNTQAEIDEKIDVIVEALRDGSTSGGGGTPPLGQPACREVGRKTVVMFRDPAGHVRDYLNDESGFTCALTSGSASCNDGGVCECESSDAMNPEGSTSFAVSCTEDGGDGETFNFTAAETDDYSSSGNSGGGTQPGNSAGTYRIREQNQNQKIPGMPFSITVITSGGSTVAPTAAASLAAYTSNGNEIDDALAVWKTAVGANIYDVSVAAGTSARFNVFLVRDTTGVARLGGTVDGTPIDKVTLSAGNYSGANDIDVFHDAGRGEITFMFSGAARTALIAANRSVSYVVTDANGEVQKSATATLSNGLDIPGSRGTTWVASQSGSCVVGQYVLLRIGSDLSKVYLPRCKDAPQ